MRRRSKQVELLELVFRVVISWAKTKFRGERRNKKARVFIDLFYHVAIATLFQVSVAVQTYTNPVSATIVPAVQVAEADAGVVNVERNWLACTHVSAESSANLAISPVVERFQEGKLEVVPPNWRRLKSDSVLFVRVATPLAGARKTIPLLESVRASSP